MSRRRLRFPHRFLFLIAVPLALIFGRYLLGCAALESVLGIAGPALAEAGAKAFSAAIDDAERQTGKPATDPQITKLRKRVAALEKAEKTEAIERAKERAADLRALSSLAKEIALLRGELTEGIEALRSSRVDGGSPPPEIVVDAGVDGGAM